MELKRWAGRPVMLLSDFGFHGPYVGQMKAALSAIAPKAAMIDLMHDIPAFDIKAAAYLLSAIVDHQPEGNIYLCVVDPGVGGERLPVCLAADGNLFIGPDNGLFDMVARRANKALKWRIDWQPENLSKSFHGRDLFAPVAAMIVKGEAPALRACDTVIGEGEDWPDDLAQIIYCDTYGNAMTGIRADRIAPDTIIKIGSQALQKSGTFCDIPHGCVFWYKNSIGLVEIAVNQGSAVVNLDLRMDTKISAVLLQKNT